MTNLTSEQYRDVLYRSRNSLIPNVPNVQELLRLAVIHFYECFNDTYPDIAAVAPGRIGLLGDQTEFCGGMTMSVATPMTTLMVGKLNYKKTFTIITKSDVNKPTKVTFCYSKNHPLRPGQPPWLDHIRGMMSMYPEESIPCFNAVIESSVPFGVGFGSSSAIQIAVYSFLEVLVGMKENALEKSFIGKSIQNDFVRKPSGLVERLTSILGKDRHAIIIDYQRFDPQFVPLKSKEVALIAIDSHLKDFYLMSYYDELCMYLQKAAELLGYKCLRQASEDDLTRLEEKINELKAEMEAEREEAWQAFQEELRKYRERMKDLRCEDPELYKKLLAEGNEPIFDYDPGVFWTPERLALVLKRTKYFITEIRRIKQGRQDWLEGNYKAFGDKLNESQESLEQDLEMHNKYLEFLVKISKKVPGVYGSRMTGIGLENGGGVISVINRKNIEEYVAIVTNKFYCQEEKNRIEYYENYKKELDERNAARIEQAKREREEAKKQGVEVEEDDPCRKEPEKVHKTRSHRRKVCKIVSKKSRPKIKKVDSKARDTNIKDKNVNEETEEDDECRRESDLKVDLEKFDPPPYPEKEPPTFYVVSPFNGARMIPFTKYDFLRSLFAKKVPQAKTLVQKAMKKFEEAYGHKATVAAVGPSTMGIFGEFMEFHKGISLRMALNMVTVVVGAKNDSVCFSFTTTSKQVPEKRTCRIPLPEVRPLEASTNEWVNFVCGVVENFKGCLSGFDALIESDVPMKSSLMSCSALQSAVYTFLEGLLDNPTDDIHEKSDRCQRSEFQFQPQVEEIMQECSVLKYFPTLMSKEGYAIAVSSKKEEIHHYYIDDPKYVFLIAHVRNVTTEVTLADLYRKTRLCQEAAEILNKSTLVDAQEKHIRCLVKRDCDPEMIRVASYIIMENVRTYQAIEALRHQDYETFGCLMTKSHYSLRDEFEVSCQEMDDIVRLAMDVSGVLGAKMIGRGLVGTVLILVKTFCIDNCIRHIRHKYRPRCDKPVFYVTKPSAAAYVMTLDDLKYIP